MRINIFIYEAKLREDTHKKVFFSGRATKGLHSLHQWLLTDFDKTFDIFSPIFGLKQLDFREEKKVVFCLVVRGVYPPYTLSGPTTKKNTFLCVSSLFSYHFLLIDIDQH